MTEPISGLETIRVGPPPRRSVPHFGQKLTGPAEVSARYPQFAQGGCAAGAAEESGIRAQGITERPTLPSPVTKGQSRKGSARSFVNDPGSCARTRARREPSVLHRGPALPSAGLLPRDLARRRHDPLHGRAP